MTIPKIIFILFLLCFYSCHPGVKENLDKNSDHISTEDTAVEKTSIYVGKMDDYMEQSFIQKFGIREDDVILEVNGVKVQGNGMDEIRKLLKNFAPEINATILRDGKEIPLSFVQEKLND